MGIPPGLNEGERESQNNLIRVPAEGNIEQNYR
jgi:hypothetical protein